MTTEKRYCQAIKKDGTPCHGWPDKSGLCPAHRPGFREIAVYGGQCKSRHHQLETRMNPKFKPVIDLLANGISETHAGKLQPAAATAMASLAAALIRVTEFAELMQRVEALEKRMKSGKE